MCQFGKTEIFILGIKCAFARGHYFEFFIKRLFGNWNMVICSFCHPKCLGTSFSSFEDLEFSKWSLNFFHAQLSVSWPLVWYQVFNIRFFYFLVNSKHFRKDSLLFSQSPCKSQTFNFDLGYDLWANFNYSSCNNFGSSSSSVPLTWLKFNNLFIINYKNL